MRKQKIERPTDLEESVTDQVQAFEGAPPIEITEPKTKGQTRDEFVATLKSPELAQYVKAVTPTRVAFHIPRSREIVVQPRGEGFELLIVHVKKKGTIFIYERTEA